MRNSSSGVDAWAEIVGSAITPSVLARKSPTERDMASPGPRLCDDAE